MSWLFALCYAAIFPWMVAHAQYPPVRLATDPLFAGVPVEMVVPTQPVSFRGTDQKYHLVYELHVSNFSNTDLVLKKVEVFETTSAVPIALYEGDELTSRIRPLPGQTATSLVTAGTRTVIFVWLDFADSSFPRTLSHHVEVSVPQFPAYGVRAVDGGSVRVAREARVISPPLRGGDWWASNGPSNDSHHRRMLVASDGVARFPERYATDWARQRNGELLNGDPSKNPNYFGYGSEVLAVADGIVVSAHDGIPDNQPDSETRAIQIDPKTIAGNYVILDIGDHEFALYAHLQPHSIRAKVGDHVVRSQVLALLGNSGNSTGPHLHFQLSDRNAPIETDGLPFMFDSVELAGRVSGEKPTIFPAPQRLRGVLPLDDDFVRFR